MTDRIQGTRFRKYIKRGEGSGEVQVELGVGHESLKQELTILGPESSEQKLPEEVFEVTGKESCSRYFALELERIALEDEVLIVSRKRISVTLDFYSGIIFYQANEFPG
jgi:hypothetical protein